MDLYDFYRFKKKIVYSFSFIGFIICNFCKRYSTSLYHISFWDSSIIEFFNISQKITKNKFIKLIFNTAFIIFVFLFCTMFFLFSNFIQLKIIYFIILIGCIASDLGGYIIGKIFKGPKLTSISPNKTISGALDL